MVPIMADILLGLLPKPRREIIYVLPDVNVQQCCELMVSNDIGALVVWDEVNIQGILSERDLIRKCPSARSIQKNLKP